MAKNIVVKKAEEHRVPAEKAFWLKSDFGQIVAVCHSIGELTKTLKDAPEGVFKFHTAGGRNDFAQWIAVVFKNKELAQRVRTATTKAQLVSILMS